jgi:hypothetical protein
MLIAEARVETDRPGRYLAQLCRHVEELAQARPRESHERTGARGDEMVDEHSRALPQVEWAGAHGIVSFGEGRCILRAEPGVLTLRVEARDEDTLRSAQQRVSDRLERFGRRDGLTVTWSPPQRVDEQYARKSDPHRGNMHD